MGVVAALLYGRGDAEGELFRVEQGGLRVPAGHGWVARCKGGWATKGVARVEMDCYADEKYSAMSLSFGKLAQTICRWRTPIAHAGTTRNCAVPLN